MSLTSSRTRRLGACVALAVLVAGCAVPFEGLNDVDTARRAQLQADPWIDADLVSVAGPVPGTNLVYDPAWATVTRYGLGSFTEVANAELAAARAQGWEPVYGRCPVPRGVEMDAPEVEDIVTGVDVALNGAQSGTFVLSRSTGDGATAVVAVTFVKAPPAPLNVAEVYRIALSARVPHHATISSAPPSVVDLGPLVCLGGAGGQWEIGDPQSYTAWGW